MIRSLRRLLSLPFQVLGYACFLGAFVTGFISIWNMVKDEAAPGMQLGELWFRLSPETLQLAQPAVQRYLHPAIWDPGVLTFLLLPSWFALILLAALCLLIAQLIYRVR
ncbi:hypothetical protein [Acuticoccus sp. I52.16.1]|uniref:hypothetical protein n=1 Tax=Acuticoccus sp. I52.16.1 TaxID=2928472 RepID=UPI001FCF8E79|nr:hypothetical protein [Acuticoccus sp. I52.16.1]UOM32550.1 hypothetical protein MRB58_11690 [Acuticoccus sp. I52.16.1]